ncbi:uncharacterized protein [Watersipora subatra]|uniref:uncharacterized protein n=1 Tax=Watersipora subatra TaxID=2589382 RepID=UPI00355C5A5E
MAAVMTSLYLLALAFLQYARVIAGETILVFYDTNAQRSVYGFTAEEFNGSDVNVIYQQCENSSTLMQTFSSLHLTRKDKELDRTIVVGSCAEDGITPLCIPQVICNSQSTIELEHIINLQQTIPSVYPSLRELLLSMNTSNIIMIYDANQKTTQLVEMLTSAGLSVTLRTDSEMVSIGWSQVAIATNRADACSLSRHHITLFLVETDDSEPVICGDNFSIYTLRWETTDNNIQLLESISASLKVGMNISSETESIGEMSCLYNSMNIAQSALSKTRKDDELLKELRLEQERVLSMSPGGAVIIRRNDAMRSIVGSWSQEMGLNITEDLEMMIENGNETGSASSYDAQLTALGIVSAFAVIGVVYSVALIAFNCSKSKDRTIKLTSPNMNIMVCFGSLLALLSLFLLGMERPILDDLDLIATFQQAGIFSQSVGLTIVYSSILVKTWRVHRIFKKMHLSSKGTKDEHLILMVLVLTLIDISINASWAKIDQILCVTYLPLQSAQMPAIVCSSTYQMIWSCLLILYKLIIIITTLFYARHVRHVKLPSLQDSQFILTNSLVSIIALLTSLPALASSETISTTRYTTCGLATLAVIYSTLSLLLAPKILLVRNKDGTKSSSAVKFLFGESLKKHKEKDEHPKGCWSKLKSCNSQSGSSMGDSMLSQEIETLKQLVKEKDETIRELTDRLFFGADKFKAYVKDKTASYRRSCSSPAVNTVSELEGQQADHGRTRQGRYNQKLQGTPVSYGEPKTIDVTNQQHPSSQPNYYTVENAAAPKSTTHCMQLPHTLTPIKELSANDLANHCKALENPVSKCYRDLERSATPTTDSAINMSHSASSSEDECYQEGQYVMGGTGRARLFRLNSDSLQAVDPNQHNIQRLPCATERSCKHPQAISVKRLAAASRRPVANQLTETSNKRRTNHLNHSQSGSNKEPISREEVELDIVFPVSECL